MDEISVCCETDEQVANSVEHSELAGTLMTLTITLKDKILDDDVSVIKAERSEVTSTAMMLFNNGYVVMMDTRSMMDNSYFTSDNTAINSKASNLLLFLMYF